MANELIDLSRSGSLGLNSQNAFASLGYGFELKAEFCNGVNLQLEVGAAGKVGLSAHLVEFFEAIIEIEAGVEAGLQIAAQLSPRILDEMGLIVAVKAYLKAYIRARLELQLSLAKIRQDVTGKATALQFRIFEEFIDQVEIGVGVEANAQIALTAAAEIVCRARIIEENNKPAGFDFRTNAEAAFMFGAGFDFFAMTRFMDINKFFRNTKDILLEEIEATIRERRLFSDYEHRILFLTWNTALDLIISCSKSDLTDKRQIVFESTGKFIYDLFFEEVNRIYRQFLNEQVIELGEWMVHHEEVYAAKRNRLLLAIENLQRGWEGAGNFFTLLPFVEKLLTLVEDMGYDKISIIRETASHIYFIGYLVDEGNRESWKVLPPYVQQRFLEVSGRQITEIAGENDSYEYLEKSCFKEFLREDGQGLGNPVEEIIGSVHGSGITVSGFLRLLLTLRDEDSKKQLLSIGFDVLNELMDKKLLPAFVNKIKLALRQQGMLGAEYTEVLIENVHSSYKPVFMPLFRKVFTGTATKKDVDNLTLLSNRFLLNLLAKNVVFFTNEVLTYSTQSITDSIDRCEQRIRGGTLTELGENFFRKMDNQIEAVLPFSMPDRIGIRMMNKLTEATNEFILDILGIARTSMGRDTWTELRIARIGRGIEYIIFNPDSNHLNFSNLTEDQVKDKIDELFQCDFLPDFSKTELTQLIMTLQEISLQQLKAFLLQMPLALALYFIKLLKILFVDFIIIILDELWEKIKEAFDKLAEIIAELKKAIEELIEKLEDLLKDLKEKIGELFDAAMEALDRFFDGLMDVLDFSDLNWLQSLIDAVFGFLSGDTEEEKARKVLNELRKQAKQNLENSSFQSSLLNMARQNEFDNLQFRTWMYTNVVNKSELDRIKFREWNAVNKQWSNANIPLAGIKASISRSGSGYYVNNLVLSHYNNELIHAELKYSRYVNSHQHLQQLNSQDIHVNSPVSIDPGNDDIPIFGRFLYLDIDFGSLDIRAVIDSQIELNSKDLIDPDGEFSLFEWRRKISNVRDRDRISPIQVKVILNGNDLNLKDCEIKGNSIQGHIHKKLLKHGANDLYLLIVTPSAFSDRQVIKHIRFYCDHKTRKHPSNSVYIDPHRSVINSMGDDHLDAQRKSVEDKETVVITNNSDKEVKLDGWKLSDAAGHTYVFGDRTWLKPGSQHTVFVGETIPGAEGWKGYYQGRLIALLNNRGEFLKLEDKSGKVVSHLYTGSPSSNRHIKFINVK